MDFDFDDLDGDDKSKVIDISGKFLEILNKPDVKTPLAKLKDSAETAAEFEKKRNAMMGPFLEPLLEAEGVDFEWIENQLWALKDEDQEVGEKFKEIFAIYYMGTLGPLEVNKGECVEAAGDPPEIGVVTGFDKDLYSVRFYPSTVKKLSPDKLKKLDKSDHVAHMLEQVLGVLSSAEGQTALNQLRASAGNKEDFDKAVMPVVEPLVAKLCKHHGTSFSDMLEAGQTLGEVHSTVGEKHKQVSTAMSCSLGPLQLAKGDCVEISDLDPEQKHLNGKSAVVSGWHGEQGVYEVSVIGDNVAYAKPGSVRKLDDLEKTRAIQVHIMSVLATPGAQGAMDGLRYRCANMVQYAKKLPETMRQVSIPALEAFGASYEWYSKMLADNAKDRDLRSMAKRIETLTSFGKIGPWGLEKGAFYEAYNIVDADKKDMNGTAVLILSWDDGKGAYDVSPVGKPANTTQLPADNLKPIADKTFSSKDEAAKYQKELEEVYASSSAKDAIAKLKAEKPDVREYLVALKQLLLDLQKPLLKKYGFREDFVGVNHVQRALAPYEADPEFAKRTSELERCGVQELRYDGKVALVTGGGRGLGRAYAKILAARGAKVVVNNRTREKADQVVAEITAEGGTAVAEYSDIAKSAEDIVPFVIEKYGKIDIVVANAGQLDDHRFEIMKTEYFTTLLDIHVYGHFKVLKAAWTHLTAQKYGRIVLLSSESGLHGNFGQSNYGAVKMAMASFGQTMAMEGYKDGVLVNILCPVGLTRMTNDLRPIPLRAPEWELLSVKQPSDKCVGILCHESCKTTAGIFRAEEGSIQAIRWESDDGFLSFDPSNPSALEALASTWPVWGKFEKVSYPGTDLHVAFRAGKAPTESGGSGTKAVAKGDKLKFAERVAIVTGAGSGIGRQVALFLAVRGCKIVVNDVDQKKVDKTVADIKAKGGEAVPSCVSLYEEGEKTVETAMEHFDQLDIVVACSTVREDAPFANTSFEQFSKSMDNDLIGHVKVLQAAWPQMFMGRFGRIVLLSSESGLHGAEGQFSYGAAKGSFVAVGQTLAMEGYKYNLLTNCIVTPEDKLSDAELEAKLPAVVAPIAFLCHESCKSSAGVFRVNGPKVQSLRWQSDEAFVQFDPEQGHEALESVAGQWMDLARWSKVSYPGQAIHMSYR